jgi:hypothetical protein
MTKAQVEALQTNWKEQAIPPGLYAHPTLELEASEGGYLTGNHHCVVCGDAFSVMRALGGRAFPRTRKQGDTVESRTIGNRLTEPCKGNHGNVVKTQERRAAKP